MNKKALQIANQKSRLYAKGYDFRISEDKMEGAIVAVKTFPEAIELSDIAEILKINGIRFGICDPSRMTEALADNPKPKAPWTIASGKPPVADEKAKLVYHFNTDPLRIGTLKETGFMDYKDRGKIPQVKADTLVVEKILGKKGNPGTDVHGNTVPPPKAPEIRIRCGKGVSLSEDGLTAVAVADGRPVKSADGKAHVFTDLNIAGDIGIRTGHVDFDGHVEVEGIVNAGYRVKAGSLTTREITNAQSDIVGNINILGGVNGAELKAGSNLRAHYIHQSTIHARGDVIVDRDVSNSTIISGGTVIVDTGKILTSTVQAKNGISAAGIGSISSQPCELIVGIDSQIDEALAQINAQIAEKEVHEEEQKAALEELNRKSEKLAQLIVSATEVQNGTHKQLVLLVEKYKSLQSDAQTDTWKLKSKIDVLRSNSDRSVATVAKLRENQQLVFQEMENLREEIDATGKAIGRFEDEIKQLDDFSRIKEGVFERNPVVQSLGMICAGTSIRGPHASVVIKSNLSGVKAVERKSDKKDAPKPWRMVVK